MFKFRLFITNTLSTHRREMSVQVLKDIFLESVKSVAPQKLISSQVRIVNNRHLVVRDRTYELLRPCYVVGFGKAVLGMATELESILRENLQMGVVTVPRGIFKKFSANSQRIKFIEGAHNNIPDEEALKGAEEIKNLVAGLGEGDTLIVLISGGGSALLPLPAAPITLREKQALIKDLSKNGADIFELNSVRKQISTLKGGGLARLAFPATVISLILSDIVGDPLDFIASGPTTPNRDRSGSAINVIKKYNCYEGLPDSIKNVLSGGAPEFSNFGHVTNYVIGNNKTAAEAARQHAQSLGFQSAVISTFITGDVKEVTRIYVDLTRNLLAAISDPSSKQRVVDFAQQADFDVSDLINFDFRKDICLIAAGEPTVVVKGTGKGGRNQQLALELAIELNKLNIKSADISFLSGGTDGMDGPTDAAGAIINLDLINNSLKEELAPENYRNNNDAYGFFTRYMAGTHLIKIGHTGTNVMDMHILLIRPK